MKKKVFLVICAVFVLFSVYFIGTGFLRNTSAFIEDYTVSDDGTTIAVRIGLASSAGYIRSVSMHYQDDGMLCLDCRAAFGGINGSIGAKNTFTFPLAEDTTQIALFKDANRYEIVLVKAADGTWQRAPS